jgi:hypothetical protein
MSFRNTGILGRQFCIQLSFSVYEVIDEKLIGYLLWSIEGNKALRRSLGKTFPLSKVLS